MLGGLLNHWWWLVFWLAAAGVVALVIMGLLGDTMSRFTDTLKAPAAPGRAGHPPGAQARQRLRS